MSSIIIVPFWGGNLKTIENVAHLFPFDYSQDRSCMYVIQMQRPDQKAE